MYQLIRPLLFRLDPETAHTKIHSLGKSAGRVQSILNLLSKQYCYTDRILFQRLWEIDFSNPVGLAAGFDKNAELIYFMQSLGFGYVEVGSVTALSREGNPRPRLFRLTQDEALINRMGLGNKGASFVARKLETNEAGIPTGVNVAKTHDSDIVGDAAIQDMLDCYAQVAAHASYATLNVSCPNTKDGRTFEDPIALSELLAGMLALRESKQISSPLLVKLSNDVSFQSLDTLLEVCERHNVHGYVISNTSVERVNLATPASTLNTIGTGGLSGPPIRERAIERVRYVSRYFENQRTIIGLGGISRTEDALRFIEAGASLLQLYTGLVYQGPSCVSNLNRGIAQACRTHGVSSLSELRQILAESPSNLAAVLP